MNTATIAAVQSKLVFGLGQEEYAIDIALVQELRSYGPVTRLANAPAYLKGVINLRGVIVPLFDLRLHFGQSEPSYNDNTVVIILILDGHTSGIVVDSVSDVLALTAEQIRPAPAVSPGVSDHVLALASIDERMMIVLDIAALLHQLTEPAPLALAA